MAAIKTSKFKLCLFFVAFLIVSSVATIYTAISLSQPVNAAPSCTTGTIGIVTKNQDPKKCYEGDKVIGDAVDGAVSPTPNVASGGKTTDDDTVTCAIEKIGWILCPVMETAGKASDKLFQFLADSLLEIEPELFALKGATPQGQQSLNANGTKTSTQNGTYLAWDQARNIANVMFIIAFVIIVISQVTSYGISNYGVKRMLPRLIVAAIAVNVSFYICQLIVDLSNILGYNLYEAMRKIASDVGPSPFAPGTAGAASTNPFSNDGTFTATDGFMGALAAAILASAGAVFLFMAPLGAIALFVIITVATIIIILLLRKAFIVLLVVASPIAFVLYLLPNTERYFQKWLSMLWKLLLVFPIVAMLMGGGQLASAIILSTGTTKASTPKASCAAGSTGSKTTGTGTNATPKPTSVDSANDCEGTIQLNNGSSVSWSLGLIATGVAVAPLLAVWSVLQGALAAAGAIGGKMAAAVSRAQDRQKSSLQKASQERRKQAIGTVTAGLKRRALTGEAGGNIINAASFGSIRRGQRRDSKYKEAQEKLGFAQEGYNKAAKQGRKGTTEDAGAMVEKRERAIRIETQSADISAAFEASFEQGAKELAEALRTGNRDGADAAAEKMEAAIRAAGEYGTKEQGEDMRRKYQSFSGTSNQVKAGVLSGSDGHDQVHRVLSPPSPPIVNTSHDTQHSEAMGMHSELKQKEEKLARYSEAYLNGTTINKTGAEDRVAMQQLRDDISKLKGK